MSEKIAILGSGTWGTALAITLCRNNRVTVWCPHGEKAAVFDRERIHPKLPGIRIPAQIRYTGDLREAADGAHIVIFAVPSTYIRQTARQAAAVLNGHQRVVSAAKGIEPDTLYLMSDILQEELSGIPDADDLRVIALSGPTHAEEVAADMPSAIISACPDKTAAAEVAGVFRGSCLRVYTQSDLRGVELCGAAKNVMALAAGMAVGIGCGDNLKAVLITRGIAEMARLGSAMGCLPPTFSGLAGTGDLIVTATSMHSRNNRAGIYMGQGDTPEQAVERVGMVVEGLNALPALKALADRYRVYMPIVGAVYDIVYHGQTPRNALEKLMASPAGDEQPEL